MANETASRIDALRSEMKGAGISAVIIPRTDAHLSEYISAHWHVVRYLSGFTGSAGTLVVTLDKAMLWTDSRYFLQAGNQLKGSGIELMKDGLPETPSYTDYLCSTLPKGSTVGVNGLLFSISDTAALRTALHKAGISLDVDFDPINLIWKDRPALPDAPAYVHDVKFAGETAQSKIERILASVAPEGAQAFFTSALDEIAWLLNVRSADVPCNPVATSFLYLAPSGSVLFMDGVKADEDFRAYLAEIGVEIRPYGEVMEYLSAVPADVTVYLGADKASGAVAHALEGHYVTGTSPVAIPKAIKNEIQIEGIRAAHVRDGVAMVRSLMEIYALVEEGKSFTELDADEILLRNRRKGEYFKDLSFESICGFGANGAIVHYTATPESNTTVTPGSLLLLDSGANYLDGTTDLTRTIAIGTPTAEMRHDFTLVVKGHIAIATAIYPEGTRGAQLDAMARMPLWKEGKTYLHGTGHGVGHFLNVHEGPQSIRLNDTLAPLTPGMITSNEPGIYIEGKYGIRCENLVLTVPYMTTEFGKFYAFETLTLCPIDRSLFETAIMTDEEIAWVNDYHQKVYTVLAPELNEQERAWLAGATAPIKR